MVIKKSNLIVFVFVILLAHTSLVQRILSWQGYYYVRWISAILLAFLLLIFATKYLVKNVNILLMTALILFCMSSLYSSFLNRAGYMFHVGVFNVLFLIETFYVFKYVRETNKIGVCINTLFFVLSLYCFINDVLMFMAPETFYGNGKFFLYSKFYIAYLHMVLFTLYQCRENKKVHISFFLWVMSMVVCIYTDCSTGIVGLVILLLLLLLPDKIAMILKNEFVALAVAVGCSLLLLLKDAMIMIPAVRYFIVDILHESIDLNSRMIIYQSLAKILNIHPLWGFGAENNYDACQRFLVISPYEAAPDAQNGLIDWLISYGRIGTIILLIILFLCFRVARKKNRRGNVYFMCTIYSFFVLGSIEIVFDIIFFFLLFGYVYLDLYKAPTTLSHRSN